MSKCFVSWLIGISFYLLARVGDLVSSTPLRNKERGYLDVQLLSLSTRQDFTVFQGSMGCH